MPPKNSASTVTENDGALAELLKSREEEFKAKYPLTYGLMKAWDGIERPFLRVVSAVDGFRRGGIAHVKGAAIHDLESFKRPEQIEQILADPTLTTDLVPAPEDALADTKADNSASA